MQISVFEIIAQIINFFILLFILKKLFYSPVKEIMEKRQAMIEENISNAERKNSEANELISKYEKKLSEIEIEKAEKMNETKKEAEEYRRKLIEKYQAEADDKKAAFLAEVKEEKDDFAREVRDLMARGTVDIARNLFGQFERETLEEHLFDALIRKIRSFSEEKKEGAAMDDDGRFVLVSAGKVDEEKKTKLKDALDASRFEVSELEYREDDSLVAGYVLQMQDYTIFSSISHYMDKKEQQMVEYFEQAVEDRSEQYDTQK